MNSIKVRRLIGARALLCAAALAIVASALVSTPAEAAPAASDLPHCAIVLPYTGHVACFSTVEEVERWAGAGEAGPTKDPQAAQRGGTFAAAPGGRQTALVALTLLSREYDGYFWTGRSLSMYGTGGPCTFTTADTDYETPTMPAPPQTSVDWNQRVSSFRTYNNCYTKHWDLTSWNGNFVGYQGGQAVIAGLLDNDTSSMQWS
jgi:hypothetical protein